MIHEILLPEGSGRGGLSSVRPAVVLLARVSRCPVAGVTVNNTFGLTALFRKQWELKWILP